MCISNLFNWIYRYINVHVCVYRESGRMYEKIYIIIFSWYNGKILNYVKFYFYVFLQPDKMNVLFQCLLKILLKRKKI